MKNETIESEVLYKQLQTLFLQLREQQNKLWVLRLTAQEKTEVERILYEYLVRRSTHK